MKQVKLPNNIKEVLSAYGVPNTSIEIVENHYSGIIHEVLKEVSEESKEATKPVDKEREFRNETRKVAEQSRMVK